MLRAPLRSSHPRGRVPAVAVDDQDPAEALARERVEQVGDDREEGLHAKRRAARIGGEARRDPVRQHGKHQHAQRLRRLDGDALGEDVVGRQRQVRVLLGRAERQHDAVVAPEVLLQLHPVAVLDAHEPAAQTWRAPDQAAREPCPRPG